MNITIDPSLRLRLILTGLSLFAALLIIVLPPTFTLIAFLALVISTICFFYPHVAFYILIFSMLFSPEIILGQTAAREVTFRMDDLLLMIIVVTWLARSAIYKELAVFRSTPFQTPIALFMVVSLLATLIGMVSGRVGVATGVFFNLKIFEYFVVFFMVVNYVKDEKDIKTFVILILLVAFLVNLYALYQVPSGVRVSAPFEGEFGEPNTLGGYLLITISLTLAFFLLRSFGQRTNLLIPLLVLSGVILMFTQSRGSWMGAILMSIPFILLSPKRLFFIVGAILLVIALPYVAPESTKKRFAGTFRPDPFFERTERIMGRGLDPSASERVGGYKEGFEKWKKHPLFGYGVTGAGFIDGQFIRVLVETGIVGLSFFLFLLWRMALFLWDTYWSVDDPFYKALCLGMLGALAGLIGHSVSANSFIIVRVMEPFWFLLGLVAAYPLLGAEQTREE
ncbi:MAG: O-antigen ligase family protein [Deltaproteobacteria bacterium]|nr:O-antigen ligase family protein [Deltaproteobacteria bacterium]